MVVYSVEELSSSVNCIWSEDTCGSIGNNVEDPVSAYDSEASTIQQLSDVLAAASVRLRRERNKHVKINTLSPDILKVVFRFASLFGKGHTAFVASWTCSYWRAIALAEPLLWHRLPLGELNFHVRQLCLKRSGGVPLTISCKGWDGFIDEVAPRIECLHLTFPSRADYLSRHGPIVLPNVAHLSLDFPENEREDFRYAHPETFQGSVLTSMIFDDLSRLRHLTLTDCVFAWSSKIFRHLTELSIYFRGIGCVRSGEPAFDQDIMEVFRASPNLRKLQLSLFQSPHISWDPTTDPALSQKSHFLSDRSRIVMCALQSVILDVPNEYAEYILKSIELPADKMTLLDVTVRPKEGFYFSFDGPIAGECIPAGVFQRLHDLKITINNEALTLTIQGVGTDIRLAIHYRQQKDVVYSEYDRPRQDTQFPGLSSLLPPRPNVRHIIIDFLSGWRQAAALDSQSASNLASLLRLCTPSLTNLILEGWETTVLNVLRDQLGASKPPDINWQEIMVSMDMFKDRGAPERLLEQQQLAAIPSLCNILSESPYLLQRVSFDMGILDKSWQDLIRESRGWRVPEIRWNLRGKRFAVHNSSALNMAKSS